MTDKERQQFREAVHKDIERTQETVAQLEEATRPVAPDVAIGRISRMDSIVNKSVNEAALATARDRLLKLQRVLGRIDEPDFGECAECGEPIPFRRLMAMPETDVCVNCAE